MGRLEVGGTEGDPISLASSWVALGGLARPWLPRRLRKALGLPTHGPLSLER